MKFFMTVIIAIMLSSTPAAHAGDCTTKPGHFATYFEDDLDEMISHIESKNRVALSKMIISKRAFILYAWRSVEIIDKSENGQKIMIRIPTDGIIVWTSTDAIRCVND